MFLYAFICVMMTVATVSLDSSGNFWDQRHRLVECQEYVLRGHGLCEKRPRKKKHGAMENVLTNSNSTCLPAGSKLTLALSKNTNPPALQISRHYTILYNHNVITQLFPNHLPDSRAIYLPKILKELDCLCVTPLQQTRQSSGCPSLLAFLVCLKLSNV